MPLRVEGPTRTMRGVPARYLRRFRPATGASGAYDLPGRLDRREHARCVTAGWALRRVRGNGAAGSGPRRCAIAQEEAGQAAPPPAARVPNTPCRPAASIPSSFTLSVHVPRILREPQPGPVGLARRRCALENDREESPHSHLAQGTWHKAPRRPRPTVADRGELRADSGNQSPCVRLLRPVEPCPDCPGDVVSVDAPLVGEGADDV